MSFNLSLTEDQIKTIMEADPAIGLTFFRDSNGSETISEGDNFHTRLKFYINKTGSTRGEMLAYFRNAYPTLLSSESGLNHIINGIRTPKLSVVMAMAEFLEIAPALLLPGVAGSFIVKEDNHVELLDNPILLSTIDEDIETDIQVDEDEEVFENSESSKDSEFNDKEEEDTPFEEYKEEADSDEVLPESEMVSSIMVVEQAIPEKEIEAIDTVLEQDELEDSAPVKEEEEIVEEPVDVLDEEDLEDIDDLLNSIF